MNENTIEIFLDTNIFLHYPPIKQIDWISMSGCSNVNIVLCMQVIHELDEYKNDSLLSKRASKSIKEIDSIYSSGKIVSNNVSLDIFDYEIKKDDFPEMLSFESKDDRIVHTVKKYVKTTSLMNVCVCSEDYGMKLRCRANSIACIEPEKSTRLPNPRVELEKKYDELTVKYKQIKETFPVLKLILQKQNPSDSCNTLCFELTKSCELINIDIKLEEEKVELKIPPSPESVSRYIDPSFLQTLGLQYLGSGSQSYARYISTIKEYLGLFKEYLESLNVYRKEMMRSIKFIAIIKNDGNAPASNVDVYLEFPSILAWIKVDNETIGGRPVFPERPQKPKSYSSFLTQSMVGYGLETSMSDLCRPHLSDFFGKKDVFLGGNVDDGLRIHFEIGKVKHGSQRSFEIELGFKSLEECSPFEIDVEISADNVPDKIKKRIPIIVRHSS